MEPSNAVRRPFLKWAAIVTVGVALLAGVTWGIVSNLPDSGSAGTASEVPPEVTDLPTPDPGKTDPIEKSHDPIEVALSAQAEPIENVFVELESIAETTAGKNIPGETSGTAIKVAVRLVNKSATAIDTAGAAVTLEYNGDDRTPAISLLEDGAEEWPAEVAPGATATAIYFYSIPLAQDENVRVIVDLLAMGPDVVFEGPRPTKQA